MVDIYQIVQLTTRQYAFFSAAHGTFCKINILGYKARVNNFKKLEITHCIISDHNEYK
jgi:hypothetical protein